MIQVQCPASCGELLQGWMLGGEKLISYPINCYSRVTLREGWGDTSPLPPKAQKMLRRVFEYYQVPLGASNQIQVTIDSEIPLGKGMASSTADLAAIALAAATYLGKTISEGEIAALCVAIEPTDSTIFSEITLFDHLKGDYIQGFGPYPQGNVLLLEGKEVIDTIAFRRNPREAILRKQGVHLERALELFRQGIEKKCLATLAEAATISALANQPLLYKPGLEELIQLALDHGAFGVNIAHSGSVYGILYQDQAFDQERFLFQLQQTPMFAMIQSYRNVRMVSGGAQII